MTKIELTLKINGVKQEVPVPPEGLLTHTDVADMTQAVTGALISALNDDLDGLNRASAEGEVEAARIEAEAEAEARSSE